MSVKAGQRFNTFIKGEPICTVKEVYGDGSFMVSVDGYDKDVAVGKSGHSALNTYSGSSFDILLIDVNSPVLDIKVGGVYLHKDGTEWMCSFVRADGYYRFVRPTCAGSLLNIITSHNMFVKELYVRGE